MALSLHEGEPGHHFQVINNLEKFRVFNQLEFYKSYCFFTTILFHESYSKLSMYICILKNKFNSFKKKNPKNI